MKCTDTRVRAKKQDFLVVKEEIELPKQKGSQKRDTGNDYYPRGLYDSTELREVTPYPILGKALSVHDLLPHSVIHSGYCAPLFEGLGIRQQMSYQFFLLTQK